MAEDQNDHEGMSRGHCNIGNCLRSLQEYEESIEHYTKVSLLTLAYSRTVIGLRARRKC